MQITLDFINRNYRAVVFLFLVAASSGCGTKTPFYGKSYSNWKEAPPPPDSLLTHSVYLLGNVDLSKKEYPSETLQLIREQSAHSDSTQNTLVVLGDLTRVKAPDTLLDAFVSDVKKFNGNLYFLPGEKDWGNGASEGLGEVLSLEQQIEERFKNEDVFLPDSGCAGPSALVLNDELVIIFIDSQWWLHSRKKPEGDGCGCKAVDKFSFTLRLEEMVDKYEDKNILIVQHHPLFSNGHHGGFFSLKDHIFPLTFLQKNLYLPLPLVGSIYPILRYMGISRQDLTNHHYKKFKEEILSVIEDKGNITLAAAHDHNLLYRRYKNMHEVLAGSPTKTDYAQIKNEAAFVYQHKGIARLKYYSTGECWLEFLTPGEGKDAHLVFRSGLYALDPKITELAKEELTDFTDSTNTIAAGPEYKAGKFKKWLLGDHYRTEWATPVKIPLLDLKREEGGLELVKKGGGNQTISLEVKDKNNIHYDLRSVNKNPKGAVPSPLFNTFAQDVVQDQISSAHPYGALAVPRMEKAIHIYYPSPDLFQIPYSPLLGKYYNDFAGMMVFKEVELDEDLSAYDRFGNSKNVVSENTLYEHLEEDNDNEFDEKMFIRARLFDMLVGDWDRHAGQWGFAEFEKEDKGSLFKPIPKDRDQVFAQFDGVLPYLASRKWAVRKFTHFDEDFGDMIGLNYNARYIDRRLLSSLEWQDWSEAIDSVVFLLTDDDNRPVTQRPPCRSVPHIRA